MAKRFNSMKTLTRFLIFSIAAIVVYSVTAVVFQSVTGAELSPTLTTCIFGFFGTEIAAVSFIKVFKIKGENTL